MQRVELHPTHITNNATSRRNATNTQPTSTTNKTKPARRKEPTRNEPNDRRKERSQRKRFMTNNSTNIVRFRRRCNERTQQHTFAALAVGCRKWVVASLKLWLLKLPSSAPTRRADLVCSTPPLGCGRKDLWVAAGQRSSELRLRHI